MNSNDAPNHPEIKYAPGTTVQVIVDLDASPYETVTAMVTGVRFTRHDGWVWYRIMLNAIDEPQWIPEYLIQDELLDNQEIHSAIDASEIKPPLYTLFGPEKLSKTRGTLVAVDCVIQRYLAGEKITKQNWKDARKFLQEALDDLDPTKEKS